MASQRSGTLRVGLLHPGEMGAALGAALKACGYSVAWASERRSPATAARAVDAGLEDAGTLAELARRSDVIVSVCPPDGAAAVASAVAGFSGLYVDANAVSPSLSRLIGATIEEGGARFVDGALIGPPPRAAGDTRLYLCGEHATAAGELFSRSIVDAIVLGGELGTASALKMAYAAWTKGSAALLLLARALARAEGVEDALLEEWRASGPQLEERSRQAAQSATTKGWRWVSEMNEIAATLREAGLPGGAHEAAGEVFAAAPRQASAGADEGTADGVLDRLLGAKPVA